MIIARDPDIPAGRQRVFFEASAARAGLRWVLNGRPAAEGTRWQPVPGLHELLLEDEKGNRLDSVHFTVRGS